MSSLTARIPVRVRRRLGAWASTRSSSLRSEAATVAGPTENKHFEDVGRRPAEIATSYPPDAFPLLSMPIRSLLARKSIVAIFRSDEEVSPRTSIGSRSSRIPVPVKLSNQIAKGRRSSSSINFAMRTRDLGLTHPPPRGHDHAGPLGRMDNRPLVRVEGDRFSILKRSKSPALGSSERVDLIDDRVHFGAPSSTPSTQRCRKVAGVSSIWGPKFRAIASTVEQLASSAALGASPRGPTCRPRWNPWLMLPDRSQRIWRGTSPPASDERSSRPHPARTHGK